MTIGVVTEIRLLELELRIHLELLLSLIKRLLWLCMGLCVSLIHASHPERHSHIILH